MIVFSSARAFGATPDSNPIARDEQERISFLRELMGERLYVPDEADLFPDDYKEVLNKKRWIVDINSGLWVYGEYFGACVKSWGKIAKEGLCIADESYHLIKDLSRGAGDDFFDKKAAEGKVVLGSPLWVLG